MAEALTEEHKKALAQMAEAKLEQVQQAGAGAAMDLEHEAAQLLRTVGDTKRAREAEAGIRDDVRHELGRRAQEDARARENLATDKLSEALRGPEGAARDLAHEAAQQLRGAATARETAAALQRPRDRANDMAAQDRSPAQALDERADRAPREASPTQARKETTAALARDEPSPTLARDGPSPTDRRAPEGEDFRLFAHLDRLRRSDDGLKLAFVFPGDRYGQAGERFLRQSYPGHTIIRATSLEQLADHAAGAVRRAADASGKPAHIGEIVIVTHANEHGAMKIPMTEKDAAASRERRAVTNPVTPWGLSELGRDMRAGEHQAFTRDRQVMIDALDETSRVVIRGCEFGRSNDGLAAVSGFFGGRAEVYAPTGLQGFEARRLARGREIALYDSLARQGLLSPDAGADEKRRVIRDIAAKNGGEVSEQFFVGSEGEAGAFKALSRSEQLGEAGETFKTRTAVPDPSVVQELRSLTRQQLAERASALARNYRPEYAPLLLAMQDAWFGRLAGEPPGGGRFDAGDPLGGLPTGKIASDVLRADAEKHAARVVEVWRSSNDVGGRAAGGRDPLMSGDLRFAAPADAADRAKAERQFGERLLNDLAKPAAADRDRAVERPYSSRGLVDSLTGGGVRLWNFGVGRDRLRDEFAAPLRELADRAKAAPEASLVIVGHTSTPGSDAVNARLALARAQAVAGRLIELGVPADRIVVVGQGERDPLGPDATARNVDAKAAARNRRVDVRLEPPERAGEVAEAVAAARMTTEGGERRLAEQIESLAPESNDALGEVLNLTGLAADVVSHLAELAEVSRASYLGLVGPVIDMAQHVREMQRLKEAWRREAQVVGMSIGLGAARILAAEGRLDRDVTPDDLARVLASRDGHEYVLQRDENWQAFARLSSVSTISWDRRMASAREGLGRAAALVNAVMRTAEAVLREKLVESGKPAAEVERQYDRHVARLRVDCIAALEMQARRVLKSR